MLKNRKQVWWNTATANKGGSDCQLWMQDDGGFLGVVKSTSLPQQLVFGALSRHVERFSITSYVSVDVDVGIFVVDIIIKVKQILNCKSSVNQVTFATSIK